MRAPQELAGRCVTRLQEYGGSMEREEEASGGGAVAPVNSLASATSFMRRQSAAQRPQPASLTPFSSTGDTPTQGTGFPSIDVRFHSPWAQQPGPLQTAGSGGVNTEEAQLLEADVARRTRRKQRRRLARLKKQGEEDRRRAQQYQQQPQQQPQEQQYVRARSDTDSSRNNSDSGVVSRGVGNGRRGRASSGTTSRASRLRRDIGGRAGFESEERRRAALLQSQREYDEWLAAQPVYAPDEM